MTSVGLPIIWMIRLDDGALFPLPQVQYEAISTRLASKHLVRFTYPEALKASEVIKGERALWQRTAN